MSDELRGYLRTAIRLIEGYQPECETRVSLDAAVDQIRGVLAKLEAARTPGPATAKLARLLEKCLEGTDGTNHDQVELRSDRCSAWMRACDARAFIAEHEAGKGGGA
jgi:hypothetical protein